MGSSPAQDARGDDLPGAVSEASACWQANAGTTDRDGRGASNTETYRGYPSLAGEQAAFISGEPLCWSYNSLPCGMNNLQDHRLLRPHVMDRALWEQMAFLR